MIRDFLHDYPWFHRWMGLVGNTLFVVGSVFFLFDRLVIPGTWIFVGASFGLMVDSVGEKVAKYEDDRRRTSAAAAGGPAGS
jgi:YrhK-like protein